MMSAVEILRQARALIADKSRWTRHVTARDETGNAVASLNPSAVCWCAEGATIKCAGDVNRAQPIIGILDRTSHSMFGRCVAQINDGMKLAPGFTAHEQVLSVFDRAIVDGEAANA